MHLSVSWTVIVPGIVQSDGLLHVTVLVLCSENAVRLKVECRAGMPFTPELTSGSGSSSAFEPEIQLDKHVSTRQSYPS